MFFLLADTHQQHGARQNFQSLASRGFPQIRAGFTTTETSSTGFPTIRAGVTTTETSSRFPSINPFPELRPVIKQEPEFNQMNIIKPVYAELPESSGPPSSQLIEQPNMK